MTPETIKTKSKWMSKHLRHSPQKVGLVLEEGGWVAVADLIKAANDNHMSLTFSQLQEVVKSNDKQRFAFDQTGTKIRANQGHSVEVDLQLQTQTPPDILYHGTAEKNRAAILEQGLHKGRRHHVHLSRETQVAVQVGSRHGKPLVLTIDALGMHAAGFDFFRSDNGVWLVDEVPPRFIST